MLHNVSYYPAMNSTKSEMQLTHQFMHFIENGNWTAPYNTIHGFEINGRILHICVSITNLYLHKTAITVSGNKILYKGEFLCIFFNCNAINFVKLTSYMYVHKLFQRHKFLHFHGNEKKKLPFSPEVLKSHTHLNRIISTCMTFLQFPTTQWIQ